MKEKLIRFMTGRNGNDELNRFLLGADLALILLATIFSRSTAGRLLMPLALVLLVGAVGFLGRYLLMNDYVVFIESFGVGGIPRTLLEVFYREMERWISKGKLVVMATQVANEGSNMEIYEVGQKVKEDFNLIEAYDMTLEATVTKLMYLMAECGNNYVAVADGFYKTINYDILCH